MPPFESAARQMFTLAEGYGTVIARPHHTETTLRRAAEETRLESFGGRFLTSEWRTVVDRLAD